MQATGGTPLTSPSTPAPRRRLGIFIGVAAAVLTLDVISKIIVVATLSDHPPIRLLGGLLTLEETRNAGAAFSIGTGATALFALVAIGVIIVIVRTARRLSSVAWAWVLGLLLGGATGNLIDRLVRSPGVLRGEVVDWIRLPHFAVFNIADAAITIGGVLAVLLALSGRQIDGTRAAPRHAQGAQEDGRREFPVPQTPGRSEDRDW
ncbi:MAG: signal peptidase II [Acidothermus sp.]|nr:signal peptidase II [Acidothermus sp.]MCL6537776.1 signal peptidase II [Acidothermus sp.]